MRQRIVTQDEKFSQQFGRKNHSKDDCHSCNRLYFLLSDYKRG